MAGTDHRDAHVAEPFDRELESLEARVRWKLSMRQRLTESEARFFVRMNADKDVWPDADA